MVQPGIEEVIDRAEWNRVLSALPLHDFHHTHDYHRLSCRPAQEAVLLSYVEEGLTVALPLVRERIPGTFLYDYTSVYGYGGPVCSQAPDAEQAGRFAEAVATYMVEHRAVAVFSRLHPYIADQERLLTGLGEVCGAGNVVNIDITLPPEEVRAAYGKSVKNQLNRLRRNCSIRRVETDADLVLFAEIYVETMDRLAASDSYLFDLGYFRAFRSSTDFETVILLAIDDESGEATAGAMFVKTGEIVQYHLSGTRTAWIDQRSSKLLIDAMRIEAAEQGYRYFNLGGGLGARADTLFDYKASFSKDVRPFSTWRYIVSPAQYDELVVLALRDAAATGLCIDPDFFPRYRAPASASDR